MRKKIIWFLSGVLGLVAMILFILTAVRLDLLVAAASVDPPALTRQEMLEDFGYFYRLVRDYYPFVEAIEKEKSLDDFYDLEDHYRGRIENCRTNREFIGVIGEMVQRLEQGTAHCDVLPPGREMRGLSLWSESVVYNVGKKGFFLRGYWWDLLDLKGRRTHARLETVYRGGKYVVISPMKTPDGTIAAGSAIEGIDRIPVDAHVQTLQDRIWLRFDVTLGKVYCHHSPFLADSSPNRRVWEAELTDPQGKASTVTLQKRAGYQPPPGVEYPEENVTCVELDDRTGYIRINAFTMRKERPPDEKKIEQFFNRSGGRYRRLIIDIRGNLGGAPRYWQEIFMERLLTEPRSHAQYSMVKKKAYDQLGFYNRLLALKYRHAIRYGRQETVTRSEWPHPFPSYLDPKDYRLLKNTRIYRPRKPFPFEGEIFLLVDHDTFSAAEDFAKTAREMDFATLVGASTIGGAAVSFAPWVFELPRSHILLGIEIEMAFNEDGSINEVYGTTPDYRMQPSAYPTEMPRAHDREALLKDAWIGFILDEFPVKSGQWKEPEGN